MSSVLPAWADVLIIAALPVILGIVLAIWGAEEPDNAIVHQQEDEKPPDSTDEAGPDDVLIAA